MSRASRIPYHQNVYDLLGIEPAVCPDAARMIAAHEATYGPLPASVREWYLVPNAVPLQFSMGYWDNEVAWGTLWHDYSNGDVILSLEQVLNDFAATPEQPSGNRVRIASENGVTVSWWIEAAGAGDPRVWRESSDSGDPVWDVEADCFSNFLAAWITRYYQHDWAPISRMSADGRAEARGYVKEHGNGLWLRAPDESFHPPVLDFLAERFGDPHLTPRADNVTTYTWRPAGGTLRVTADEPGLTGGLSAWFLHAETPERLSQFAELLVPWGTLRDTLRADTEAARAVLNRVRGS